MADKDAVRNAAEKDPHDWATSPQESYLSVLAQQAGGDVDTEGLSRADASLKIETLQEQTGR